MICTKQSWFLLRRNAMRCNSMQQQLRSRILGPNCSTPPLNYGQFQVQFQSFADSASKRQNRRIRFHSDFPSLVFGPNIEFALENIACLAEASVMGASGQTVAMATITSAPLENPTGKNKTLSGYLRDICRESSSNVPLSLDYRQRHPG